MVIPTSNQYSQYVEIFDHMPAKEQSTQPHLGDKYIYLWHNICWVSCQYIIYTSKSACNSTVYSFAFVLLLFAQL